MYTRKNTEMQGRKDKHEFIEPPLPGVQIKEFC